jgi:hypothetical protein
MAYDAQKLHGLNIGGIICTIGRDIDVKFATTQDGEIVKKSNGEILPPDEPIFLLRARDRLALQLLHVYRELSVQDGCNDYHMEGLEKTICYFTDFKKNYPERMKQPSITRGQ